MDYDQKRVGVQTEGLYIKLKKYVMADAAKRLFALCFIYALACFMFRGISGRVFPQTSNRSGGTADKWSTILQF